MVPVGLTIRTIYAGVYSIPALPRTKAAQPAAPLHIARQASYPPDFSTSSFNKWSVGSQRRSPPSRQRFKPCDRRLTWGVSGDR
jgi:hypothetical protein